MRLSLRKPTQSLNKAYAKLSIAQERMDTFQRALGRLFSRVDEDETEEHQKSIVASFLNESFYGDLFEINTRERTALIIHHGPDHQDPASRSLPGAIIEIKRVFAGEMITPIKNNVKALHELILHYFEERERHELTGLRRLIITDVYNWFIFDEDDFRRFFYDNARLRKLFQIKQQQRKDNTFFYSETARILRELDDEVPVTYLNLREAADLLNQPDGQPKLIPVYKLLSPEHLLKVPFANDADELNRSFYDELLHIIGLHETVTVDSSRSKQKLIQRLPEEERHEGSLLENTISILRTNNVLANLEAPEQYGVAMPGVTEEEQLVEVSLTLCITWLSRILFLKLLEGQQMRYHHNDKSLQFLTSRYVREFAELDELFFQVMAVPEANRSVNIRTRYGPIPYLNSSLFEPTELEHKAIRVKALKDRLDLPLYSETVLRKQYAEPQTGTLPTLNYLLSFLDAYDFSFDKPAEIQSEHKPLINSAVLGLILEKLNGYRDGSFFTPGFITTYMVRDAISRAVVSRFNERFTWGCQTLTDIHGQLDQVSITDANEVINSLRICDPAVGSGHLLVSALNELIAIKAELGILADRDGRPLQGYDINIVNDDLVITDEDGLPFQYFAPGGGGKGGLPKNPGTSMYTEMQRIQETLFHEKQTLVENCLFGVDINPNSIIICRLRLWIELLKSVYYKIEDQEQGVKKAKNLPGSLRPLLHTLALQTLPNFDINFKVGNSLIGRFEADRSFSEIFEHPRFNLDAYRAAVSTYKQTRDKTTKEQMSQLLGEIDTYLHGVYFNRDSLLRDISRLRGELALLESNLDLFGNALPPIRPRKGKLTVEQKRQKLQANLVAKEKALGDKRRNPIFRNAFEWRFEFPEVLDNTGSFVGFDLIISHPSYTWYKDSSANKTLLRKLYPNTYASKASPYVMFIEQGMKLLRPGGQLAYMLPNKWMRINYATNLRKWLKNWKIEQIVNFNSLAIFDDAPIHSSLLLVSKAASNGQLQIAQVETITFDEGELAAYIAKQAFSRTINSLPDNSWVVSDISL